MMLENELVHHGEKMLRKQSLLNIDYFLQRLKMTIFVNKKAFQWNANRPLANSTGCIVNKFEHVAGGRVPVW